MSQVTRTEAIKNFLVASTHPELAELYHFGMEVQVNVAQDGGERVESEFKGRKWHGWTDGLSTWKSFRIPYNANKTPEYEDRPMRFDLAMHAEGIGMTGWCWTEKQSKWVAFDFDAIVGHSDRHAKKMNDETMKRVEEAALDIPWVTVHRSTSGKGLHLYVFLDLDLEINNHHEHAALARSILGTMSAISGFDFTSRVDVCGGNMWVWHRKMKGTDGLTRVKEGEVLTEIPENWRDHLTVVSGKRRKIRPSFLPESTESDDKDALFEELTGQQQRTPLDEEHRKLTSWLSDNGKNWWWDSDHHMLVTHTYSLKCAYEALGLKGIFDTISKGDEGGVDHNCFAYPMRRGAWVVRRYTPGTAEKSSWDQDAQGWTRCYLNREPDLRISARSHDGLEHPSGGYIFREGQSAQDAALKLGINLDLPTFASGRRTKLKQHKDGRLIAEFDRDENDQAAPEWLAEGKTWKRVFNKRLDTSDDIDMGNFDDVSRHVVTESGEDQGWVFKSDGTWINEPMAHVKVALQSMGYKPNEVSLILGSSVFKPWVLVNEPFQPEYLGDRKWNRGAPQLRFAASSSSDALTYDHWLKILTHLGSGLNEAVAKNGWCKANGIISGADYLKCWVASIFQNPLEPLPYLFFWSAEQNTGKSIFHESLELLITRGYARADQALQSQQGFNGELANSVLCVVEETDLRRNVAAYNRIKDWVTAKLMPIQQKYKQPYLIPNSSHWIQCANDHRACPVFQGDTRITMVHVEPIEPIDLIPKRVLLRSLEKEAPDFLSAILNLELPPSPDRLGLPVLETEDKLLAATANLSLLETFLDEKCYHVPGAKIKYSELYERFQEWLDPNDSHLWTKHRMGRELPPQFPKARLPSEGGQYYVGNLSFEASDPLGPKYVVREDKLVPHHDD